jgi:hypothetical protein
MDRRALVFAQLAATFALALGALLLAGPAWADLEIPRSKSKDDTCARFEASAREVLASPLFPAVIAIGADGQIAAKVTSGIARATRFGLRRSSEVIGLLMLRRLLGEGFEESREPIRVAVTALLRGGERRRGASAAGKQAAPAKIALALRKAGRPDLEPVLDAFAQCGRFRSVGYGSRTPVRRGDLLVAPDGMVIAVVGITLGGTKLTSGLELRLQLPTEERRILIRAGESQPWKRALLGLLEAEKGRGGDLLLAIDLWDREQATGSLAFGKPFQLAAGGAARAPDGLLVTVRRLTVDPPFALVALKLGTEASEVWIKPASPAPHAWRDYLVQVRALTARGFPKRSTVELSVEKPRASVVNVSFDSRFTLKLEASARLPDGLRLSFLGARKRQLKRGGTVAYLKLRLEKDRVAEEREFELFEPGRGWTRTLAWKGYRIGLPGDREKTTEMELVVSK